MINKKAKVLFLGDGSVGKTSICRAYLGKELPKMMTIGIEIEYLKIDDKDIVIWDISGQKRFQEIVQSFVRGADLVVLVFDLSRKETLFNLKEWINIVIKNANSNVKAILVGNKADLAKEVTKKDIDDFLQSTNVKIMDYIETSARTNHNIKALFKLIFQTIK